MLFRTKAIIIFIIFFGWLLNGLFIPITVYADPPDDQNDPYLAFAEVMPEVEGGLASIVKKIEYPAIAKKAGIMGKVYVMAFIDEAGNVNDVKVIKGIGGGCDEAAVEAIKKSKFSPGLNANKPVKVKLSLPITFQLK